MAQRTYVLVTKTTSLKSILNGNFPKGIALVVEEFIMKRLLDAEGLESRYLDSFIGSGEGERYNRLHHALGVEWFKNENGSDVMEHRGIALGEAFYPVFTIYIAVPFFKFLLAVKGVLSETSSPVFYLDDDAPEYRAVLEIMKIPFHYYNVVPSEETVDQLTALKYVRTRPGTLLPNGDGWCAAYFKNMVRKIERCSWRLIKTILHFGMGHRKVLVSSYYPTAPVIAHLKKRTLNEVYYVSEIVASGKAFADEVTLIESRLIEYFSSPSFRARFLFDGFDCADYFGGRIISYFREYARAFVSYADAASRFLVKNGIELFLTPYDYGVFDHTIIVNACKSLGIPTVVISDGVCLDFNHKNARLSEYKVAYSSLIKKEYYDDDRKVAVLGNPYFDGYARVPRKKLVKKEKYNILVAPPGFTPTKVDTNKHLEEDFLIDVMTVLKEFAGVFNVFLKPHPAVSARQIEFILEKCGIEIPEIVSGRFIDALVDRDIDLFLSTSSTTCFESAIIGVPVIFYNNEPFVFRTPFDGRSELVTARSPEELHSVLKRYISAPESLGGFSDRKNIEKYTGRIDGRSTERVAIFIERLLSRGRSCESNKQREM